MNKTELRLGIDIGRVIIGPVGVEGKSDTPFLNGSEEDAMRTEPMPLAFETITELVEIFEGRVWLVSKAGPRTEGRTRRWLDAHRFFTETGVLPDHLRFCRERHEKANHCRELAITDFIDDRVQVLEHLRGLTPRLYLFGPQRGPAIELHWLTPVLTWPDVRKTVIHRLPGRIECKTC